MFRSTKSSNSSFSTWMAEQQRPEGEKDDGSSEQTPFLSLTYMQSQMTAIGDNVTSQLQDLSGMLPEAGPLSAAFRARVIQAVYLLIASAGFAILAIFVGLPTLIIRPSKFVICITLSTLLGMSSVIVLQKPSVFLANIFKGGFSTQNGAIAALICSIFCTLYITIFIHRYLYVLAAGGVQVFCMLYYLASFIPGGTRGLELLLKTAVMILRTALGPLLGPLYYVCKNSALFCFTTCYKRVFSS